nr:hypothetical protein OH820_30250 [Streptomyces sp. NBC_00857]
MSMHAAPEGQLDGAVGVGLCEARPAEYVFGPPILRILRDVVADRLPDLQPLQAAMLFWPSVDLSWDGDRFFPGDFYNSNPSPGHLRSPVAAREVVADG